MDMIHSRAKNNDTQVELFERREVAEEDAEKKKRITNYVWSDKLTVYCIKSNYIYSNDPPSRWKH